MVNPVSWTSGTTRNVKSYGAVGNGTADDTAAINAAISAASPANAVFPHRHVHGLHHPDRQLQRPLAGRPPQRSFIKCGSNWDVTKTSLVASTASNYELNGLTFDSNSLANTRFPVGDS